MLNHLDARLRTEALALVRLTLGLHDFEYIRIARSLCYFRDGVPIAVRATGTRGEEFLQELQVIHEDGKGNVSLNLRANDRADQPLLWWNWKEKSE
jgi:hypothetical protein